MTKTATHRMNEPMRANAQSYSMRYEMKAEKGVGVIRIYGTISQYAHGAEDNRWSSDKFGKELATLGTLDTLNVYINSPGGSVAEAMAMRSELLLHQAKEKNLIAMGDCASAATLLLCQPKDTNVHVKAVKGAMFLYHNPMGLAMGTAAELEETVKGLRTCEENVAAIYAERTGRSEEQIRALMNENREMTAAEAMEWGFIDEVVSKSAASSADAVQMTGLDGQMSPITFSMLDDGEQIARGLMLARQMASEDGTKDGSNAQWATDNNDEQERTSMTLEELMQQNRDVYDQAIAEGARMEQERLRQLDEVYAPGYDALVTEAKYGEKRMTAAELCMALNKQMRTQARQAQENEAHSARDYLNSRKQETAAMSGVGAGTTQDHDQPSMEAEMDKAAQDLASFA